MYLYVRGINFYWILEWFPAVVENSTMTPDGMDTLAVGEKMTYACVFGFEKTDGDLIRTCEIGPAWSGKAPVCSSKYY
jgi:hypothetical protein